MLTRATSLQLLLATAVIGQGAATNRLLASDHGMQMIRLLQESNLQVEDFPDICAGFELLIDEIPDGRDSCECDGSAVHCLFHAVCPEGEEDQSKCADTVLYEVAFEETDVTVLSCAALSEGGFEETCAKVSLAPDLQLDQCLFGSYGGKPCDCEVCPDRGSLKLDCTAYDKRAQATCTSGMGLGQMTPIAHGFNTTATEEEGAEDVDQTTATTILAEDESSVPQTLATTLSLVAAFASVAALL